MTDIEQLEKYFAEVVEKRNEMTSELEIVVKRTTQSIVEANQILNDLIIKLNKILEED